MQSALTFYVDSYYQVWPEENCKPNLIKYECTDLQEATSLSKDFIKKFQECILRCKYYYWAIVIPIDIYWKLALHTPPELKEKIIPSHFFKSEKDPPSVQLYMNDEIFKLLKEEFPGKISNAMLDSVFIEKVFLEKMDNKYLYDYIKQSSKENEFERFVLETCEENNDIETCIKFFEKIVNNNNKKNIA